MDNSSTMVHTIKIKQVLIRIICVSALVLLSFAHKPIDIRAPLLQMTAKSGTVSEPVFIRYETMADGSIVSICVSEHSADADNHHQPHHILADCDACRISAGFVLATPPATGGPVVNKHHSALVTRTALVLPRSRLYPPAAPPHAPPALA